MKKIKKVDYEKVFFITMVLVSIFASCNNESKDSHNESEIKTDSTLNDITKDVKPNGVVPKRLSGMSIDIPEDLNEVDIEKIKARYPGANRPTVVYGSEDMSINLAYSITKKS